MNADRLLIVSLVVCGCSGFSGDWHPAGRGGAGGTDDETSGGAGGSGSGSGGAAGTSGGSAGAGAGAGTGAGGTSTGGKGGTGSSGGNGGVGGATGGVGGSTGGIGGATGGVGGTTGGVGGSGATGGATGGTAGSTGGTLDAGTIVDAGKGGTGGTVPTCDAQSGTATPVPEAPAQCTSGKKWTSGNGPTMSPGDICQGCHGFSIAGTVYPTIHETGLCNGVNGGAQVVITPSCGAPITLTVNNVGNFYYTGTVRQPFTAKVIVNGVERAMVTPQTLGDCNACHTQNGLQGAPGRIIVP